MSKSPQIMPSDCIDVKTFEDGKNYVFIPDVPHSDQVLQPTSVQHRKHHYSLPVNDIRNMLDDPVLTMDSDFMEGGYVVYMCMFLC